MQKIRMELENLTGLSTLIKKKIGEFDAIQQEINHLNQSIESSWEGIAKETYRAMTDDFYSKQQLLKQILETFQSYTSDSVSSFQEVDAQCAQRIRNAF